MKNNTVFFVYLSSAPDSKTGPCEYLNGSSYSRPVHCCVFRLCFFFFLRSQVTGVRNDWIHVYFTWRWWLEGIAFYSYFQYLKAISYIINRFQSTNITFLRKIHVILTISCTDWLLGFIFCLCCKKAQHATLFPFCFVLHDLLTILLYKCRNHFRTLSHFYFLFFSLLVLILIRCLRAVWWIQFEFNTLRLIGFWRRYISILKDY